MLASGIAAKRPNVWKRNNFVKAKKMRIKTNSSNSPHFYSPKALGQEVPQAHERRFRAKNSTRPRNMKRTILFDSITRYKRICHLLVALSLLLKTTLGANYLIRKYLSILLTIKLDFS